MKNTVFLAVIVASLTLTGVATYKAWDYRSIAMETQNNSQAIRALALRDVVLRDAGYPEPTDAVAASRAVRDWVYRKNKVGSGKPYSSNGALIYANLGKPGSEQLCGGMSVSYSWALNAIGIPARIVHLAAETFLAGEEIGDTHVTVEAYIEGDWRVSDPTFNAEFRCGDDSDFLDITEMRECIANGGELTAVEGKTQIPGRTLSEYYIPYGTLLAAYERAPVSTPQISEPAEAVPAGWRSDALSLY